MTVTPDSIAFPSSSTTVSVKIFNAFISLSVPSAPFLSPAANSTSDESSPLVCPGKSYLIEHPDGRKIVFDLGIRKDVSSMSKSGQELAKAPIDFGPDVAETLTAQDVPLDSINAVIWSHSHFDHVGNPSTFPPSTALVVGPGTQAHVRPGYPLNQEASLPESDFLGREVVEITFAEKAADIAGLRSHDYFGDGSFYLLDAPGHCPGHMLGLARTTPSTFILMGADAAHHPAMLRPSAFVPLPAHLGSSLPSALSACSHNAPFLNMPLPAHSIHHDHAAAVSVVEKLTALDGHPDVFVVLSHDGAVDPVDGKEGGIDFLPHTANDWKAKGWKEAVHWKFLEKGNRVNRWDN